MISLKKTIFFKTNHFFEFPIDEENNRIIVVFNSICSF